MRYLGILAVAVLAGCSPVVGEGAHTTLLGRMMGAVSHAPDAMVDALLPAPPDLARSTAVERSSASADPQSCLTPEQVYDLALERETSTQPRYRAASTRDAIEVFGRAIGPIAAARYWSRRASVSCVTSIAVDLPAGTARP